MDLIKGVFNELMATLIIAGGVVLWRKYSPRALSMWRTTISPKRRPSSQQAAIHTRGIASGDQRENNAANSFDAVSPETVLRAEDVLRTEGRRNTRIALLYLTGASLYELYCVLTTTPEKAIWLILHSVMLGVYLCAFGFVWFGRRSSEEDAG